MPKKLATIQDAAHIFENYDVFLLDCDGVLWTDGHPIAGSIEALTLLKKLGKKIVFVTNSSMSSRRQYKEKFSKMLKWDAHVDEIYGSSFLAAQYIKQNHPHVKHIYVVGEDGLCKELQEWGFTTTGGPADAGKIMHEKVLLSIPDEEVQKVDAVVAGFDRSFNFYKMVYAALCFQRNPKCIFVATNRDQADKVSETRNLPGAAGMVGAIEAVSGVIPVNVGKPAPGLVDQISKQLGVPKHRMIMVGDRMNTDIMLAKNAGITGMLVYSGVTKPHEVDLPENAPMLPDWIATSLGQLVHLYQPASKL